jgi:signal transduction histidine kinase
MGSLASQTKGVLMAGIILAVVGWGFVQDRAKKAWFNELEQEVLEDTLILTGELEVVKRELWGIISLYNSSEYVSRSEFGVYVKPLLKNHPFIQAFEWVPLVDHSEKNGFEGVTRSLGYPNYQIFGTAGTSEIKQEYFPIHYAEPLPGNERALGFDMASDPQLVKLTNTARDTGREIAVSRFGSVPIARSKSDLIILAPFYKEGKSPERTEDRREYLKGFVLGIYRIEDMINQMLSPYIPKGMNLAVYEEGGFVPGNLIYGNPLKDSSMKITNVVTVSNRRWFLVWQATDEFRGGLQISNSFWVGTAIFSAALFLSIIIEIMASRTRVVESEVRVRTDELTQANEKLVEVNDLKNKFLGIASHDLRNPLASIRGYSKFLLDKEVKEETRQEFLTTIKNVSGSMLELISNLLDISVIESGQLKLNPEKSSMKKLAEEKIHLQQILADKKSIVLNADLEDVPEFYFDPNRMGQVVDNLLSNAVKYSPPEKEIFIKLTSNEKSVTLSVKDEGPGISPDEQGQLFQHFKKLSARPTGGESSSGLGLAIAQRIVEEHQGTIGVESKSGDGALFYFSLPAQNINTAG